jgi:hypothetical protein
MTEYKGAITPPPTEAEAASFRQIYSPFLHVAEQNPGLIRPLAAITIEAQVRSIAQEGATCLLAFDIWNRTRNMRDIMKQLSMNERQAREARDFVIDHLEEAWTFVDALVYPGFYDDNNPFPYSTTQLEYRKPTFSFLLRKIKKELQKEKKK